MYATQILPETLSDDLEEESDTVVGFIVVDDEKHEIKKGETKIGRDSSLCSIAIENFTVSKVHAVIESDGIDDTFIYDVGSTNQTRLGKKLLKPHCRYKLDNGSNITLGSIVVKFILPPDKPSNVILDTTSKENYNSLDEYGDIFEVATQAILPQSNSSCRVPAFEPKSKNFLTLKNENARTKDSHGQPDSVFDLPTQCKLDLRETTSKTENHSGLHDYSEIFELSTQCQIGESQGLRENRSKINSAQELNEFKSFLNDGQDDVLCAVISLHSPKEPCNDDVEKKIKTEIGNLSQVLSAPTQVQDSIKESEEDAEVNSSLQDKEFSTIISCLPTSERTNLDSELKINNSANNNCAQVAEEDVINTQEFGINESEKKCQQDNPFLDKMTPTCLGTISTDSSMMEQKSHNEDIILTQSFEAPPSREPAIVIPESEDFMETQIYDVENEKRAGEQAVTEMGLTRSYDADFTQQDKEDDFIATQVFKESDAAKGTNRNNEKNAHSDDEDFIATQVFKEPVKTKRTDGNYKKNMADDDEDLILTQTFKEPVEAKKGDGNYGNSDEEDFIATQSFMKPVEAQKIDRKYGNSVQSEDEDFIATQAFNEPVETKRTDGNYEKNGASDEEDFIATQAFKESVEEDNRSDRNDEKNIGSDDEDFIATQVVESPKRVTNSEDSRTEKSSRESSPDLLALGGLCKDSEDCVATQTFEPVESHNSNPTFSEFSESFISVFFSDDKKDDSNEMSTKAREIVESSGDETESDLEILLDKHESVRKNDKIIKNCQEIKSESFEIHKRTPGSPSRDSNDICDFKFQHGNAEEMQSKRKQIPDSSDSDETDCEDIILNQKIGVKHEPAEPIEFEETQVLTLTPPNTFVGKSCDGCMTGGGSPKFENTDDNRPWSPLSLEMPNTQDMETSVKRRSEIVLPERYENARDFPPASSNLQVVEVGIESPRGSTSFWTIEPSEKKVHSPKKRPHGDTDVQVVPVKKSKTEDKLLKNGEIQFSKLVQAHDISQIQPYRTRNSIKNSKVEAKIDFPGEGNTNIVPPTSRRKINTKRGSTKVLNCDITPYLIKEGGRSSRGRRKKETAEAEDKGYRPAVKIESSTRVLRSSLRNSNSPNNLVKTPETRVSTRRSSRRKNSDYLGSCCLSVAFTGFDCLSFEEVICELGGEKVDDVSRCGVVVANKVRRTVKFLCAIGLSLPIASPQWLVSCKKENKFLNPWDFILKDDEAENKWDFELRTSLERSKRGKLLEGFNIFATKNAKPPVKDLLAIVECCGGTPLFEPPEVWPKKTIIVSCVEDKKFWPAAKLRNVQVVHYEFILSGVLRQKIDFKTYKLR